MRCGYATIITSRTGGVWAHTFSGNYTRSSLVEHHPPQVARKAMLRRPRQLACVHSSCKHTALDPIPKNTSSLMLNFDSMIVASHDKARESNALEARENEPQRKSKSRRTPLGKPWGKGIILIHPGSLQWFLTGKYAT